MIRRVRITSTPPGEAPEAVRRAWIGLELPLARPTSAPRTVHSGGVLSGPRGFWSALFGLASGRTHESSGWVIKVRDAMQVLEASAPDAAKWWRENVPRMFEGDRSFVFATACAEPIRDPGDPVPDQLTPIETPTLKLASILCVCVAIDLGFPLAWMHQILPRVSPKLWIVYGVALFLTLVVGLQLVARFRARREQAIERQR
jgi:hypothetical protein